MSELNGKALLSECGQYRYWLSRKAQSVKPERPTAMFVMLNPSTADAETNDPTIRRCQGFANSWRCNGLIVANLYALRSTDPKNLWSATDPIGPENDYWLKNLATEHFDVVCAWCAKARTDRVDRFLELMEGVVVRLWCLGTTKAGAPRHPLYIKADQKLIRWAAK